MVAAWPAERNPETTDPKRIDRARRCLRRTALCDSTARPQAGVGAACGRRKQTGAMNVVRNMERTRVADGLALTGDDASRGRRRRLLLVGLAAILVLLVAFMLLRGTGGEEAAPQAAPSVTYIVPGRHAVSNRVTATGSLAARVAMPVGVSGEGGEVTRVLVQPGDWVRDGQVLATIDRSVQAEQTQQMAAQIAIAEADARLAQSNLERAEKLVDRGFVSRADIELKTATRDGAVARVRLARAQYQEMRARMGRLDVRAPAAGLVLSRDVEPGQIVSASGAALFTIARDGEMELKARLAEQDIAAMRVGMPAEITPVGGKRSYTGHIWQIAPIVDPQSRQGIARIAIPYDKALRPGGFATASILSGTVNAPELPESAVLSGETGHYVYVIGAGDKVERRSVKIGAVTDTGIAILSGLKGDEHVVLLAGAFLNPGDKVTPVRARQAS